MKAVTHICLWNIIVYILSNLFPNDFYNFVLFNWEYPDFQFYQLITYQFLHNGIGHIFLNMIIFLSLGYRVEEKIGKWKFILYYFICGIFSAIFFILIDNPNSPMVGSSGAIFGIIMLYLLFYPNEKVLFSIKIKWLISFILISEIYLSIIPSVGDTTAHLAHVGGALMGLLLYFFNRI